MLKFKNHTLKTPDFLNLKEKTKVEKDTMLVSMDVTSLYTDIPQKEGINLVCKTGADPGFFFRRGAPLRTDVTNTNKPHFFRRIPVVVESRRSSQGGGAPPAPYP